METGLLIKLFREHKQVSRELMAELLDMSVNTYMKIESGDKVPTLKEIEVISEKFDVDPSIFLSKNGLNINYGNNSPASGIGNGNNITVSVDQELQKAMLDTLTKLNKFLDKE